MNHTSSTLNAIRLTGRRCWPGESVGWRKTIEQSGLPDDAQKLIITLIKKSRLMGFEKIEVVQDLIAHFEDGMQSGKSCLQLVASFGDPSTVAALIHHSKKRNRPIMFKIAQIFGWTVLALASSYAAMAAYFYSGKPTPSTDYLPQFNAGIADLAENDKAWPIYRPIWIKYGISNGGGFGTKVHNAIYVSIDKDSNRIVLPSDPEWTDAVEAVEQLSELMDCFRQASNKPRLGLEIQSDMANYSKADFQALFPHLAEPVNDKLSEMYNTREESDAYFKDSIVLTLLPHVRSFRTAASLFMFDNRVAVEQNDSQRALDNFRVFLSSAKHAADCNTLVGGIVGFDVLRIGFDSIEETLTKNPEFLDAVDLAVLQEEIENLDIRSLVKFDGERAMVHDIVQRIFTDDGSGDGRITHHGIQVLHKFFGRSQGKWSKSYPEFERLVDWAQQLADPTVMLTSATRKQTIERYDAILDLYIDDIKKPFSESRQYTYEDFVDWNDSKYQVLGALLPAFEQIQNQMHKLIGRQEAIIAAVAAHRFQIAEGRWPNSVRELSPDFVVEIPVDVMTGRPLKLSIDRNYPCVYSVGNDLDDDGGLAQTRKYTNRPAERIEEHALSLRQSSAQHVSYDGDWILWPQNQEND